ncbi:hypothetical protein KC340_g14319 [Hortaea werneckii]|nr:hypothetical protein KC342_g14666 [Hortaea werneckii]KAI7066194.1 hypothetical protein KC339_g15570 [Hortaea werneckii]KAI7216316.1 hypothetical protein KC365_g13309 [Hortaea werneckii]KAI7298471.1 hypothetical protein KC340_g14319 [Hortaea werneckii]KAI7373666.1 hypothetical protein KC328_g16497 [Hortaea werneckii]
MFCLSTGTPGLRDIPQTNESDEREQYVGKIKKMGEIYSRFRPQRKEPDLFARPRRHPAVDIPGSRTWAVSNQVPQAQDGDRVTETVTVDAHDLFSQLSTSVYLGRREPRRGLLDSIQNVSEGTIRVWRNWLSEQCETKTFSDGTPVTVHHDSSSKRDRKEPMVPGSLSDTLEDPRKDGSILWVNTRDDNVGIKFKVKEKKWRRTTAMPILFESDVEVAVSYEVEFEEILVRTAHLLFTLEEAQQQMANDGGRAIVFGSLKMASSAPKRMAQIVRLKPESLQEYKECHNKAWPEVLQQIKDCHIVDYSIWFDDRSSTLFATMKWVGNDFDADMAKMAANPKVQEWWAMTDSMQESYVEGAKGSTDPKGWWKPLEEVFRFEG